MSQYRIKAQKTGPRTFKKELQMISYRGDALYSDEGNTLISEKDVYYPPDYLSSGVPSVVADPDSYEKDGLSLGNKFRKGRPAALPIIEQFPLQSEVSRSLLGVNRAETQQGIFDDVSSYGLDRKDWVVYAGYPDFAQGDHWEFKNSPAGPHDAVRNYDDDKGSSIVLTSYPVPYTNPGNAPVGIRIRGEGGTPGPGWGRYIQSLVAMYIIEYMVNNFTSQEKTAFRLEFLEQKYPKTSSGKFNRLFWDQIWLDINQGRFEGNDNIPIIPQGRLVNFTFNTPAQNKLDIKALYGSNVPADEKDVDVSYNQFFFATTRYTWQEPDQGHYRIKTNPNEEVWSEYWGIDYNSLPENIRNWEFQVYESQSQVPQWVIDNKLPYFLIENKTPSESLIFGRSWPQQFSDSSVPQISNAIADGNLIGSRESNYAVITLTSIRAFRYQPGRISGFTYGVRVSDEGAGPGSVLEWGVENFTDGYFFRLRNGTDFAVVRRSTIPLGETPLFIEAGYQEREGFVSSLTGVVRFKDELTATEIFNLEEQVREGTQTRIFETLIEQDQMNGDGLNGQGESGYIYKASTVTMYKVEFGWYGAIGARFYAYIPQGPGEARWVTLHTLVIENQIGEPCLEDPFFYFKYRAYVDNPSRLRLPQFIEKYGASYYIDGGDEGTVSISNGRAFNRTVPLIDSDSAVVPVYRWGTVLGLKPKQVITNTVGNEFNNKKEIFPVSASITCTQPTEIKFVNQFGCRENAYTFQEGYQCVLPESQRLRGIFRVNKLQANESNLVSLGRNRDAPTPTITYISSDPAFPESQGNLGGDSFVGGWGQYNNSLHGAHLIADKLYTAYLNPTQEGITSGVTGISGSEIVIQRVTRNSRFNGPASERPWSSAELLFRYTDDIPIKISPFRRDTTLVSTVPISSNEFYLLFTKRVGRNRDGQGGVCRTQGSQIGCDGNHFGDYEIGVVWPSADNSSYPLSQITKSRANGKDFAIINPKNSDDRSIDRPNDVKVVELEQSGNYYVQDYKIPNSNSYRYYEGLPIDFGDPALRGNILSGSQAGWLHTSAQGLEVSEGIGRSLGEIDIQLPNVPGADGGECHAIYGRAGEVRVISTFTNVGTGGVAPAGTFYLSSTTPWPESLWKDVNDVLVENEDPGSSITVKTIKDQAQESYTPPGTSIRLFLLPVTLAPGNNAFSIGTNIISKYKALALYETSLIRKDARLIAQVIGVGQNIFPLRFFIRMREGAQIGGLTIGQVTPNGIVQTPFTPHGCSLSVNTIDGDPDRHDGGVGDEINSASKAIIAFSEPGTLTTANYSYFDASQSVDVDRTKRCPSFISRDLLSGAGFSGVGDYPIRWLKFKESGDPLASYFLPANTPTEIDLSSVFGINTESIGPSFWGNKAMFIIARNLVQETSSLMSITLNYKEQ